jgi:DNA-binding beta-propeller fold protein YncE
MEVPKMNGSLLVASGFVLLAAGCSHTSASQTAGDAEASASGGKGRDFGEVMVDVGRRFEMSGRAALAGRFGLARFEVKELEEMFEDDVPAANLPKEGPTAHIPTMAKALLTTNLPELQKAAATGDRKTFDEAFKNTSAACNSCHLASAKGFIEVPSIPGRAVPDVDPVPPGGEPGEHAAAARGAAPESMTVRAIALPGATGPASLDYIAYQSAAHGTPSVWVPVGVTGSVDVLDVASGAFRRVDGFRAEEREWHGQKHMAGPSSVAIGDGFAYVGDRASNEVCPVDLKTLVKGACVTFPTGIDGVATVASSHEVWVTTPSDDSITILDARSPGSPKLTGKVRVGGAAEGYAVDEGRGVFFTNLEDKAKTVVIDVKTRAVKATWGNGCGAEGPRGVAVDGARNLVMVACTDHVEVLDGAHDGALLSTIQAGAGIDNIDYALATQTLYVAAGKTARLTVLRIGPRGELTITASAETREGARNAVADEAGNVYIADSKGATLLVASPPQRPAK